MDEVINYREVPEWKKQVIKPTGVKGAKQMLTVGGQSALMQYLNSAKHEGFVYVIKVVEQGGLGGGTIRDAVLKPFLEEITASQALWPVIIFCLNDRSAQMSGVLVGGERLGQFMTEQKIKPAIDRVFS
ncbi:NAD-P-binding protein [Rhizoctonia solani]|nr:NAD-P-binding protein [Rhizoctonia solani]